MICVSIAQTSHRFAFVDILNAAGQCDMIELRLDRFDKTPSIKELVNFCPKPLLVSCRRRSEGGDWAGPEPARLALLRQAILDQVPYVEIELDVASEIRRYGATKRVIAYTNTSAVPPDLDAIYRQALAADPDVIKLTLLARNAEEAFPIVKLIAKGKVPTVAVGWGRNGLLLNILGRRYKAPWIYAALEKGMEAYPGMATIGELRDIFDYQNIDSRTPLLAVGGLAPEQADIARVLNHGFRLADSRTRCLPLEIGSAPLFKRVADAIQLEGLIVDAAHQSAVAELCTEQEETAGAVDFVSIGRDGWRGHAITSRAVLDSIEEAIRSRSADAPGVAGRTFLVIGTLAGKAIAASLVKAGAVVVLADRDNEAARALAGQLSCRYVPAGQVYTTVADGFILTPDASGKPAIELPRSTAREGQIGVDLSSWGEPTAILDELRSLGGIPVAPAAIFRRRMARVLHLLTGRSFTPADLQFA